MKRYATPDPSTGPNPSGLCMCGCGFKTLPAAWTVKKTGAVRGLPQKYIHGHQVRTRYGKCNFSGAEYAIDHHGCWVWRHGTTNGYAKIGRDYGHRVSYRIHRGEIPDGMVIDHLCCNRLCVNPNHLEVVSDSENKRRAAAIRAGRRQPQYPEESNYPATPKFG